MTQINQFDRNVQTEKLLKKKLGKLPNWKPPQIYESVGPFEPAVFDRIHRGISEVVETCQNWLAALNEDEFKALIDSDPLNPNRFELSWEELRKNEIRRMRESNPPWYAGGFGHPDYIADFGYWSQSPHYTNHEALMLSLGIEPTHFSSGQLVAMEERIKKNGKELWAPLHYLLRRKEQFRRQFPIDHGQGRIFPQRLFGWFELIELDIPLEFTSRYFKSTQEQINDTTSEIPKRPHKRELDSVAQLFTVMAIDYYGYRPDAARSPTPKEIVEAAAKVGIDISDDTVRKYLRLGASFISPDWKPDEF